MRICNNFFFIQSHQPFSCFYCRKILYWHTIAGYSKFVFLQVSLNESLVQVTKFNATELPEAFQYKVWTKTDDVSGKDLGN